MGNASNGQETEANKRSKSQELAAKTDNNLKSAGSFSSNESRNMTSTNRNDNDVQSHQGDPNSGRTIVADEEDRGQDARVPPVPPAVAKEISNEEKTMGDGQEVNVNKQFSDLEPIPFAPQPQALAAETDEIRLSTGSFSGNASWNMMSINRNNNDIQTHQENPNNGRANAADEEGHGHGTGISPVPLAVAAGSNNSNMWYNHSDINCQAQASPHCPSVSTVLRNSIHNCNSNNMWYNRSDTNYQAQASCSHGPSVSTVLQNSILGQSNFVAAGAVAGNTTGYNASGIAAGPPPPSSTSNQYLPTNLNPPFYSYLCASCLKQYYCYGVMTSQQDHRPPAAAGSGYPSNSVMEHLPHANFTGHETMTGQQYQPNQWNHFLALPPAAPQRAVSSRHPLRFQPYRYPPGLSPSLVIPVVQDSVPVRQQQQQISYISNQGHSPHHGFRRRRVDRRSICERCARPSQYHLLCEKNQLCVYDTCGRCGRLEADHEPGNFGISCDAGCLDQEQSWGLS